MDKKPKVLLLASVASMIEQFNMQNIQLLLDSGYDVDVVCNCKEGNTIPIERVQDLIQRLANKGVLVNHVPIPRNITDIKEIYTSFVQIKKLCDENKYVFMHCHSPIGSVIARFAAKYAHKKFGTRVIYTAHGFHFYKGGPIWNWVFFYPIEKICARLTDVLITINKEDYTFAQMHMNAGLVEYIPGVGIDTKQFLLKGFDIGSKRADLGLKKDDIVVLSVGELNQNKNHKIIIQAIAKLNNPKIHYFIAGSGEKKQFLTELASELGINLHLLGYRSDIVELLNVADVFAFPSFREGLSVALMEAMAAGLPCVVSDIRGNVDLIDAEGGYLAQPDNVDAFYSGLIELSDAHKRKKMGVHNRSVIREFDIHKIMKMMSEVYGVNLEA